MTATAVSYTHLTCDTCGAVRATPVHGATAARIQAAAEGWQFAEFEVKGLNKYRPRNHIAGMPRDRTAEKVVPRQWDACPDCSLPAGPEEAFKIREARKQDAS